MTPAEQFQRATAQVRDTGFGGRPQDNWMPNFELEYNWLPKFELGVGDSYAAAVGVGAAGGALVGLVFGSAMRGAVIGAVGLSALHYFYGTR